MEKEGEGRGGEENKQPQPQPQPQPPPPPPQEHHKCPRCDSPNTKFCYYNNYSLSQPRYFCKACKRYWTQGGTLRNIPVGGSRKGKRAKSSSSSTQKLSTSHPQPPPLEVVQNQSNLTTLRPSSPIVVPPTSPYYHGGGGDGFLSSLATLHSLNLSQPFNQSLTYVAGSTTNLSVVSGFNIASIGSQHHQRGQIRPSGFYHNDAGEVGSLCPAEHGLIPSSMGNSSASSHRLDQWPHNFTNHANHGASDASLWSTISTTSISGNSESNIRGGSSSLIPNHDWPDLPGNDPPQ